MRAPAASSPLHFKGGFLYLFPQVRGDRSRGREPRESVVNLPRKPLPQLPRPSPECPHLLAPSFLLSSVPRARSQSRPSHTLSPAPPPILSTHRVSFSSSISRAKGWGEERRSLEHTSAEIRAKTATTLNKRQPARGRCRRGSIKFDVISLQETLTLT